MSFVRKMGSRTVEVKPVGAWVNPELIQNRYENSAHVLAGEEEERIHAAQREKERRLRQFQEDVRQRVQRLEQTRRHVQLQNSARAVELERHVIKQSVKAAHKATPRKNNCTVRANHAELAIQQHTHSTGSLPKQKKSPEVDLGEESSRVHRHTSRARSKLVSKKLDLDDFGRDNLPGNQAQSVPTTNSSIVSGADRDLWENKDVNERPETGTERTVAFDLDSLRNQLNSLSVGSSTGDLERLRSEPLVTTVPDIYPGQVSQEERQQSKQQRAMYRRLFMDIEREQVREKQRRDKHRMKIMQLKKDKEEERKRVELASLRLTQSETDLQDSEPDELEVERTQEMELSERQEEERKVREADRFVEALKQRLREKLSQRDVQLPALCCCGDSVWDTDPNTCANNCVFYRNNKAYTKALQCVLASCDTL